MSLFLRLISLFRVNLHKAISQAEDPIAKLELDIRDLEADIESIKGELAPVLGETKRVCREYAAKAESNKVLAKEIDRLVLAGDDEAAKKLIVKLKLEEENLRYLDETVKANIEVEKNLRDTISDLETKVVQMCTYKTGMKARYRSAKAQVSASKILSESKNDSSHIKISDIEEKVISIEDQASGYKQLLDEENVIEVSSVDMELAAIKERLNK